MAPVLRTVRLLWRAIRTDRLALLGLVTLSGLLVIAVLAPHIAPWAPEAIHRRSEAVVIRGGSGQWIPQTAATDTQLTAAVNLRPRVFLAVGTGGRSLTIDGDQLQWGNTGTGADLFAVAGDGDHFVAVGSAGVIVHRGPEGWTDRTVPGPTLLGVALASSDEGLAVGEGGAVFRWNGLAWVPLESGVDVDLRAVALSEDGTGFVVGDKGTVLSYDGELLLSEPQATARSLHDVDIAEDGSAVAVGDRGTVLHMRNGEWTAYPAADTWSLRSVTFVDGNPARAVAVGEQSYVLRYEDDVWVEQQVAYRRNLTGVAAAGNLTVAVGTEPFIRQLEHPSWTFPAGTTQAGQDIMSQLIWGTRTALLVGLVTAIMVTLIGTNVGLIAGYYGGRIDNVLMRAVDVLYALPFEPLALILIAVFQPSLTLVILTIALVLWRTSARILRAQVLTLVQRPLVSSAKVAGASDLRILYQHIAPNVLPLAFLQLAVAIAAAITAEATLSFLGLGPSQVYSWGTILQQARISGAWRTAWWWTLPPGLLIMITVASVFFISRALEVFTNPRLLGAQRNA